MRHAWNLSAVVSLALALGAASVAHAQPAPVPGPAESQDPADSLFRQGNALYKERQYADARTAFERAFRMKRTHDIAANLAYTEMKLGLFRDAAEHLSIAVKIWPPTGKDDKRQYAVERLAAAKKEVGTLSLEVNVQRAEVFVDGKSIGLWPLEGEVFVEPGARVIEAKLSGYASAKQTVEAAKGAAQTVKLTLAASAGDGNGSAIPLPPGGGKDGGGMKKVIVVSGAAAGGLMLVAGVAFAVVSTGKAGAAEEQRQALIAGTGKAACTGNNVPAECATLQDTIGAKDTFANLSFWSFVSAGALGAGTLIYALVAPNSASSTTLRAAPVITARGGGLTVGGAW